MKRQFAAAMRRANKLMRPAKLKKTGRKVQAAMAGLVMQAVLSAMPVPKPKPKPKPGAKGVVSRKKARAKTAGSLGAVVSQLQKGAADRAAATQIAAPATTRPAPAKPPQYITRTHHMAAGWRRYRLYLPAHHAKSPNGLVLMLHGCNQSPDDFANGTGMNRHADKHGLVIVYPAQTTADNASACWNWFRPGNQVRNRGEPALLASLTRKLAKEFGLDRGSVYVAGLSAGGAMAAILADVYPDVFSAAGIHSGLARGSAHDVMSAMSAMRNGSASLKPALTAVPADLSARRIIFQGDKDSTVHPSNAAKLVAQAIGGDAVASRVTRRTVRGRGYVRNDFTDTSGQTQLELWIVEGAGHAWSGGRAAGSYTDAAGPDASAQMIRFFLRAGA